ncbi:MAG: hypothetical protein M1814_003808 [Vezdaea aestivalis]|nr:MAG: hypothetical protein M1814_003808 [Vezdaea aestivalis]
MDDSRRPTKSQRLHAYDSRWRVKAILRVIFSVLAVITIVCTATVYGRWSTKFSDQTYYPTMNFITITALSVTLAWHLANGVALCVHVEPIPPGYNVAFDLIGVLIIFTSALLSLGKVTALSNYAFADIARIMDVIALSLTWVACIVQFSIFVIDCIDTHRRRQRKRRLRKGTKEIEMGTISKPSTDIYPSPPSPPPPPTIAYEVEQPIPPVELESPISTFVGPAPKTESILPPKAQDHQYAPYEYAGPSGAPPQYVREHPAYTGQVVEELVQEGSGQSLDEKHAYNPRNLV